MTMPQFASVPDPASDAKHLTDLLNSREAEIEALVAKVQRLEDLLGNIELFG